MSNVLFVVAGHSGGHVVPALQLAKKWLADNECGKIVLITGDTQLEKRIAQDHDFVDTVITMRLARFPGKKFWRYPLFGIQFFHALIKSMYFLLRHRPEQVVTTGGYLSIPAGLGAWLCAVPLAVYELNVVPGQAASFLFPFAQSIYTTFAATSKALSLKQSEKCQLVAYPHRFERKDREGDIITPSGKKTILVLGGSQGSVFLNRAFAYAIDKLKGMHNQLAVIHQAGSYDERNWSEWYQERNIEATVFAYHPDLKKEYLRADLVICRAGAGTLFETAFFKKRAIVVPLQTSRNDHQVHNAREMASTLPHLFTYLEQHRLSREPDNLARMIRSLLCLKA